MTSKTALAKMGYAELLEVRKNVDEAITHRHSKERQELTKQLTSLAKLFGAKTDTPPAKPARAKPSHTERVSPIKGKKVKPKYRNPSKPSETWAGRGRQPRWLAHELSKGKNIESFLIR